MLDLVFICDCTGSMGSYIAAAQSNIRSIVEHIQAEEKSDVRFGLIQYRDHAPQDTTFVVQTTPFTTSVREMKASVDTMRAAGGGDGPEAVADGLHAALHLDWRKEATKVCVLIADAPPHGLEPSGDGFPNGCPDGHDPLGICRTMAEEGIVLYTVGAGNMSSFRFCADFLVSAAELTGGQAVQLSSASLLAGVIMGGAAEELNMQMLMREVEAEVARQGIDISAAGDLDEAAYAKCEETVYKNLRSRGMKTKQMKNVSKMKCAHSSLMKDSSSLKEAKASLSAVAPPPSSVSIRSSSMGSSRMRMKKKSTKKGWFGAPRRSAAPEMMGDFMECEVLSAAPSFSSSAGVGGAVEESMATTGPVVVDEDDVSMEQVKRMMYRGMKKRAY